MKQYLQLDEWSIIEDGFDPANQELSESIFSLGNGHMGQRANFEENYSGPSLQGSYLAGVYYPDKTRVGWWKNGYPEYFAKVMNSTNWIGIDVHVDGEPLDLAHCAVRDFRRVLNMKEGHLTRTFVATLANGREIRVCAQRFVSVARPEIGAIQYTVTALNFDGTITFTPFLDGNVLNRDTNHGDHFWDQVDQYQGQPWSTLIMKTNKLDFTVCSTMTFELFLNDQRLDVRAAPTSRDKCIGQTVHVDAKRGEDVVLVKYVANLTSRDHAADQLAELGATGVTQAQERGFGGLLSEQKLSWEEKWKESDIVIEGDVAAQQAIRFNIFQLHQTYTGDDDRLNIGPKGFTGEKYGGSTYWDTEAYCLPFYLSTADQRIARNLLMYRYRHLEKAKENAKKLGFTKGALYPMVTMNGEECHNEWEITFEEIHRNGAVAYAIFNYVNYTGDTDYLSQGGLEVLIEISRFWAQRVNFSATKNRFVILGVTGPNEYENNVNNNWYTNQMASWTMRYTIEVVASMRVTAPERLSDIEQRLDLQDSEMLHWQEIIANMYFPEDDQRGIFLQQDGFLDKEITPVQHLDPAELPLNQHWSWDRVLRSCYIKQADVLQGLFFLGDQFDLETKRRNFDFYEPITVHESSLSPCVHSILACELGYREKAYEMYLRTSRLDLDNYNNDTEDGCHITSMAGTWMSVVYGFGGLRVQDGRLHLRPFIPSHWRSFSFKIMFRGARINVSVNEDAIVISNETTSSVPLVIHDTAYELAGASTLTQAVRAPSLA